MQTHPDQGPTPTSFRGHSGPTTHSALAEWTTPGAAPTHAYVAAAPAFGLQGLLTPAHLDQLTLHQTLRVVLTANCPPAWGVGKSVGGGTQMGVVGGAQPAGPEEWKLQVSELF